MKSENIKMLIALHKRKIAQVYFPMKLLFVMFSFLTLNNLQKIDITFIIKVKES